MKKTVWISFDLGVQGDYAGLYEFLDEYEAKECGDSVAVVRYDYSDDLLGELENELRESVTFDRRSRVYVVYGHPEKKVKGTFLIGGRKQPPWSGYAESESEEDSDE